MNQKIVRMYSLNQPAIDKAVQEMADFICDIASRAKLIDITHQVEAKIKEIPEEK